MRAWSSRSRPARRSTARRYAEYALSLALFLLLLVPVARLDQVSTRTLSGRAIVHDGDTITVAGERLRLRGIDSPELDQSCAGPDGPYTCGRSAAAALRRLVGEGAVQCEGWQRDRYGRLLVDCTVGGVAINRRMVQDGWAGSYGDHARAEAEARDAKRGLWAGDFDRPQDWRRRTGALVDGEHDWLGALWRWLAQVYVGATKDGGTDEAL